MFARLVIMQLGPEQQQAAEQLADEIASRAATMRGCKGYTFSMDRGSGEYGGLSLWETQADAEVGAEALGAVAAERVGEHIKAEPMRRLFAVYEPKP